MGYIILSFLTFICAFLLFQIELILGKLLLPQYGGSFMVWGACVVFFQAILLLGYVIAHKGISQMGIMRYLRWHAVFLAIPLVFFPGQALFVSPKSLWSLPLVVDVFLKLLFSIGPVFFVLSTCSLVTQSWLAASSLKQKSNPYMLYGISNLGSFCALMSYPFFFEQTMGLSEQLTWWRWGYGLVLILSLLGFALIRPEKNVIANSSDETRPHQIDKASFVRWLLLSAGGVMMFLSVTNIMTYEIAPLPLLWVLPLGIYLLAFVFNFSHQPLCPIWIKDKVALIFALNIVFFFLVMKSLLPVVVLAILGCVLLWITCMHTQRWLIELKPKDPRHLTSFYVAISLGGFLGGLATSWLLPLLSTMLIEFLVALLLIALSYKDNIKQAWLKPVLAALAFMLILWFWPQVFKKYSIVGLSLLLALSIVSMHLMVSHGKVFIAFLVTLILVSPLLESQWKGVKFIAKHRNYYGIYEVYDKSNVRLMLHGTTLHGLQFINPSMWNIPLGYYSPLSPVGRILLNDYFPTQRLGVVGLGAGTLALYAQPNRSMDIYELDPDVLTMAQKHFHYLDTAQGPIRNIIGDARISLANQNQARYDILIIDAFGGDAIPMHLINRDVVSFYQSKLNSQGAILFHITNRYIDLKPLLANIAKELGAWVATKDAPDGGVNMRSIWALMSWDTERIARAIDAEEWQMISTKDFAPIRTWSDDYSSVLPLLKGADMLDGITHFKWWSLL